MISYTTLVKELAGHVRQIAQEAHAGDYEARSWLCESFPSYTAFFAAHWPTPAKERQQAERRRQASQRNAVKARERMRQLRETRQSEILV